MPTELTPNLAPHEWLLALLMGLGLAASCGFRVFLPLLVASVAIHFEWLPLRYVNPDFASWLGSWLAITVLGIATVSEVLAYKFPYVDHLLDVIAAPMAVIAGTVLSASFLVGIDDPILKYSLALIAGGASAGAIHSVTSLARLGSTKTTGGLGNPFFAAFESGLALVLSVLAVLVPVVAAIAIGLIVFFAFVLVRRFVRRARAPINTPPPTV